MPWIQWYEYSGMNATLWIRYHKCNTMNRALWMPLEYRRIPCQFRVNSDGCYGWSAVHNVNSLKFKLWIRPSEVRIQNWSNDHNWSPSTKSFQSKNNHPHCEFYEITRISSQWMRACDAKMEQFLNSVVGSICGAKLPVGSIHLMTTTNNDHCAITVHTVHWTVCLHCKQGSHSKDLERNT